MKREWRRERERERQREREKDRERERERERERGDGERALLFTSRDEGDGGEVESKQIIIPKLVYIRTRP